jgi:predicted hydrocarbon binding protein
MKHSHKWIATLLAGLDEQVDAETRVAVLEGCGRTCITDSMVKRAKACRAEARDEAEFLDKLGQAWKHLQREGDEVYVVYPRCYCPLVKDFSGDLSATWCNCSRGWVKELFEQALGKPVQVDLLQSIRQGDKSCKFQVHL